MTHKLLIVDDEPANLRTLERLFSDTYDVLTAASGNDGLELLSHHDVALVISDQRMPVMTGVEFLKKAAELRPRTVRIILTGYTDVDALVESINSGAVYKYLTKPWSNSVMQQTVARAMEYYETVKSQHQLAQENKRLDDRLNATVEAYVHLAIEMLDLKGSTISSHSRRTARYARGLGRNLNLTNDEIKKLYLAALLHEIAHIRIPGHFTARRMPPSVGEMKFIDDQFNKGVELLASVPDLAEIAESVRFQHEHFDGFESPNGMAGDQIPLHSQIIAIANAYDEMRVPNTAANGLTHDAALLVLQAAGGRKYDPKLVSQFGAMKFCNDVEPTSTENSSDYDELSENGTSSDGGSISPLERPNAVPFIPANADRGHSFSAVPVNNSNS
jgi:response regulator RpfG family c-di-GMP phosphodiesterase